MLISREKVEKMTKKAGLTPVKKMAFRDFDILISDGFSLPPHRNFKKFGLGPQHFNQGCYVTMWWLMKGEEQMFAANSLFFDVFHDPEYDKETKKQMRANSAFEDAKSFLLSLEKVGTDHRTVH
jgi:hypothetical protein